MGIFITKIYKRIISVLKIIIWKILYNKHLKIRKGCIFYQGTHITIENGAEIEIGKNCFFNHGTSLTALKKITIGNDCLFGENVKLYDHNHVYANDKLIRKQGYKCAEISIGNNCWIGSNVVILKGVKIGNNVVIGAGTTVTKNIKDNTVVVSSVNMKEL